MDRQDFEFEKLMVPEPIGLPIHGFDLVIRPFKSTRGNSVIVVDHRTSRCDHKALANVLSALIRAIRATWIGGGTRKTGGT
jgi:hypothetical protein